MVRYLNIKSSSSPRNQDPLLSAIRNQVWKRQSSNQGYWLLGRIHRRIDKYSSDGQEDYKSIKDRAEAYCKT